MASTSTTVSNSLSGSSASTTPDAELALPHLPEKPIITIEPNQTWGRSNFRELWHARELLYFLTWRDLKVRYKQTVLGVVWVVMQPLMMTVIFTLFLGKLARVPSDGHPYSLLAYAGLLPWSFFSTAVIGSGTSLVGSAHLITKVYFPRIIIPAAAVAGRLVDFAISFLILIALMIYYDIRISAHLLMLPVIVLLVTLLALAVGLWVSATNVRFRDVGVALPVLIQLLMFLSPVVYPSTIVYSSNASRMLKALYMLNPLVGIIDNFRAAIFGTSFNWPSLAVASGLIFALLIFAAVAFRRAERTFADVV